MLFHILFARGLTALLIRFHTCLLRSHTAPSEALEPICGLSFGDRPGALAASATSLRRDDTAEGAASDAALSAEPLPVIYDRPVPRRTRPTSLDLLLEERSHSAFPFGDKPDAGTRSKKPCKASEHVYADSVQCLALGNAPLLLSNGDCRSARG